MRSARYHLSPLMGLLLVGSCLSHRSGQSAYESKRQEAMAAVARHDDKHALILLEGLQKQNPRDAQVTAYLAQLYASRAGVDSLSLYVGFFGTEIASEEASGRAPTEKKLQQIMDLLPEVNDSAQADLARAVEVNTDLVAASKDGERSHYNGNLFYYKSLYLVYLCKRIFGEIISLTQLPTVAAKLQAFTSLFSDDSLFALGQELSDLSALISQLPPRTQKTVLRQIERVRPYYFYQTTRIEIDLKAISPTFIYDHMVLLLDLELADASLRLQDLLMTMELSPEQFRQMMSLIISRKQTPFEAIATIPKVRNFLAESFTSGDTANPDQPSRQAFIEAFFNVAPSPIEASPKGRGDK